MYKRIFRPILFQCKPENAHRLVFFALKIANYVPFCDAIIRKIFQVKDLTLEREIFGITFPNPIGLAAGLDKDAEVFDMLGNLGFGFVEIGTVTPLPQSGNPKPRLFRLVKDKALINRMGFNNAGVDAVVERLKKKKTNIIIGGNIGKNKITPNKNAIDDYLICFEKLFNYVDYFVVNVSSPNTPGLRALQDKEPLMQILVRLMEANTLKEKPKPILLKIAPDLSYPQLDDVIEIVSQTGIAGIVATNTTISRENLSYPHDFIDKIGKGGLSGEPLKRKSNAIIKYISEKSRGKIPVIAAGGVFNSVDVSEKIYAGAGLVQLYTGFIYEGPGVVKKILKKLLKHK